MYEFGHTQHYQMCQFHNFLDTILATNLALFPCFATVTVPTHIFVLYIVLTSSLPCAVSACIACLRVNNV